MSLIEVRCDHCGSETSKEAGHINRSRKNGNKIYCSRLCANNGISKTKKKDITWEMALRLSKICIKCKQEKSLASFYKDKNKKDGLQTYCKECCSGYAKQDYVRNRNRRLQKAKYNRDKEKLAPRLRPTVCEVCQRSSVKVICFDHSHKTGLFRGWLCHRCNSALGLLDDDPHLLKKLAQYLEDFECQSDLLKPRRRRPRL